MTISLRVSERDAALMKDYAEMKNMSLSDLIRESVIERIEEEIDLQAYEKARAEYDADPRTYTLDEIEKELGM